MAHAARLNDPIGHSPTMSWLLGGLLAAAAIAVAAVAIVGTGGLAAVAIVGGAAAAGAGLGEVMSTMSWAPKEVVGKIVGACSPTVFINGIAAARAHLDKTECDKHSGSKPIATGSGKVFINNMHAARVDDKTTCSATITEGSKNVNIGGDTVQTDDIAPEDLVPGWVHVALLVVGIGSAVVLGGPLLAAAGLVGGIAGGMGGNWLGGKVFGEGSDGQKWSMLGGSFLGGWLGAKGANAWTAPRPSISIYGFRGAGSPRDLLGPNPPHPYRVTGHVGYSLDNGKTIYGFGPHVEEGTVFDAVQSLRAGKAYPGKITDDTFVFESVAENPGVGRDGSPQVIYEQRIPVSRAQYEQILAEHNARGVDAPMSDVLYSFPGKNEGAYNCATYPSRFGIPIPEKTGVMKDYMVELEKIGKPWKPK